MSKGATVPVIEFCNVSKNYGAIEALKDASFEINKGEIFGYIGPNGAGKTTSLKILVGLISNHRGEIRINGLLPSENPNINRIIGYLPQDVGFQEWRTVTHALSTFGRLSGMTKADLSERIPEVLANVGLVDAEKRKIKHLSGGMKQKLKLAQALLHNPPILILDEPLSGLDPTSRWQLKKTIKALSTSTNVTILFSSHILDDVEDIATSIGIINQGKLAKVGKPHDLQKELMGGDGVEVTSPNISKKLKLIENLPLVDTVELDKENDTKVTIMFVSSVNLDKGLIQLMNLLVTEQIIIHNFNYLKPSLETVYLKYVMGDVSE
ncbi:MAG: ABC transporter ATP-binding protein [Candidatus Heimdallarchaeota archaeon]|nr:ABC transporter ATP-binding protein [Candidatus Heimdallarchaeota archaeon]